MKTSESLGIFWSVKVLAPSGEEMVCQEEAKGLIFYGLWKGKPLPQLYKSEVLSVWKESEIEVKIRPWDLDEYRTLAVEVKIVSWPPSALWFENLAAIFELLCKNGAVVGWCGGEDCGQNPSAISPEYGDGLVYAAYSPAIGLICNAKLEDDFSYLSDAQLLMLEKQLL